jgi:hypothetical protein
MMKADYPFNIKIKSLRTSAKFIGITKHSEDESSNIFIGYSLHSDLAFSYVKSGLEQDHRYPWEGWTMEWIWLGLI